MGTQHAGTPDIKEEEYEDDNEPEIEEIDNTAMKVTVEEDVSSSNQVAGNQPNIQIKPKKRANRFSNHETQPNFDMSMQNNLSVRELSPQITDGN